MAIKRQEVTDPPWTSPVWPDLLPDPAGMKVVYGALADELVIRFSPDRTFNTVVVPVTTPDEDYAALLVAMDSGAVVGIHVYPLLAFAVQLHPAWRILAKKDPQPESVARIVADINELFGRYGVDDPEVN